MDNKEIRVALYKGKLTNKKRCYISNKCNVYISYIKIWNSHDNEIMLIAI